MRIVTAKELSAFKILPFDIYDSANTVILPAGEVLTPGKLIMLKQYDNLYTEEYTNTINEAATDSFNDNTIKRLTDFSYETLEPSEFETVVNKDGVLKIEVQTKLKYYYRKVLDLFTQGLFQEGALKLNALVGIMLSDILKQSIKSQKGSQVRFLGEYELCHPLNVAIISGLIAKKLEYQNEDIEQVILAGLLHDIGKFKINMTNAVAIVTTNEEDVSKHTVLGYELIKNELGLLEGIAKVALEHHENNDGSGYPRGLSSDYISEWSQIVNVANYYDNLAFNRTTTHIANNRDVLRAMLEVGTRRFSAKILYTFIHMFTYDDPKDFAEMTL